LVNACPETLTHPKAASTHTSGTHQSTHAHRTGVVKATVTHITALCRQIQLRRWVLVFTSVYRSLQFRSRRTSSCSPKRKQDTAAPMTVTICQKATTQPPAITVVPISLSATDMSKPCCQIMCQVKVSDTGLETVSGTCVKLLSDRCNCSKR
jgi:hypothetical protein